jgi:hypothetical protein
LAIPSGNWNFETYFNASSGGGNPSFYMELYKYDGATFTLISSGATNPEAITGGTVVDLYVSALAVPSTVLLATDRLAVRIFVTTSGRNITLHTEDNNLCQIITTFTTGLNALNGLTAQVQNFATGTSGTDFGISSASTTHTFNLPTASGTNRGALSSADWTTFNGKFNTPTGTTSQYVRGDGSLNTFPTIPVIYKSTTDGTAITGIASEQISASQLIPANTFAVGDIIRVTWRVRKTGVASTPTTKLYANSSIAIAGAQQLGLMQGNSNTLTIQNQRHLSIKSATNTEVYPAINTNSDFSFTTVAATAANIDWTINQYLIFMTQISTASADVIRTSFYLIEKI